MVRGVPGGILAARAAAASAGVVLTLVGGLIAPVAFAGAIALVLAALVVAEIALPRGTASVRADRVRAG